MTKQARILELADGAAHLLPFARKKLLHLHVTMQYTGVPTMQRHFVVGDNEVHITASDYADDTIRITGGVIEAPFIIDTSNPELNFDVGGFRNYSTATEASWVALGLPPPPAPIPPFSLGMRGNKVVRMDESDRTQIRLAALQRTLRRQDFHFAEVILRRLDGMISTIPTPPFFVFHPVIDGALYYGEGREGFIVDLASYAAKAYIDQLTPMVEDYAGAFVHNPASPAPSNAAYFPEIDMTQYKPIGSFDSNPPHAFFDESGNVLPGTEWAGYGTALLNTGIISSTTESLPLGHIVSCRRAEMIAAPPLDTAFTGALGIWKRLCGRRAVRLEFHENYYIVTTSGGSSFTAHHIIYNGTGSPTLFTPGPVNGFQEIRGDYINYIRTPDGWVGSLTPLVLEEALPFLTDGEMPAVTIEPPASSAVLPSIHEDGVEAKAQQQPTTRTTYATTTYLDSEISYTIHPRTEADIYLVGPQGANPGGNTNGLYPNNGVTTVPTGELQRRRYVSPNGQQFYVSLDGYTRVRNADGELIVDLPPSIPGDYAISGSAHAAAVHLRYSFEYPTGVHASENAMQAAATVDVAMVTAPPVLMTQIQFAPPSSGQYVVYHARLQAAMYFTHRTSLTVMQEKQEKVSRAYALNDAALIEQAWEELFAEVNILANTGVPEQAILFAASSTYVIL